MNRGLTIALLLFAFVITLIGADTILLSQAIGESEDALTALDATDPPAFSVIGDIQAAYAENRVLLSVSVPLGYLNEYEEALASLSAATLTGDEDSYACARAQAITALLQMKRSVLFSIEQIF